MPWVLASPFDDLHEISGVLSNGIGEIRRIRSKEEGLGDMQKTAGNVVKACPHRRLRSSFCALVIGYRKTMLRASKMGITEKEKN